MAGSITPTDLKALLDGSSPFALLDVREAGEYNSTHIPGASWLPRRRLEFQMRDSVPFKGVLVVVCDDDGRRAALAGATLERMGYENVSVLQGGTNAWVNKQLPTEWGMNVPSKDFGEKVEIQNTVTEISADDLHARIAAGKHTVILDARTPEEYQRFNIPGSRSLPGGELALRITDIAEGLAADDAIIVNCAGRTRSIIGARALQRMGFTNVSALTNGTAGWMLAGYDLERGADRLDMPEASPTGIAAAEAYAVRLSKEDGVLYLDVSGLQELLAAQADRTIYFIDVRTKEEYAQGHIPGFQWIPGGQAVQRSDDAAVVKGGTVVFCCNGKARATVAASWYRQLGIQDVYVVDGGTTAWASSGQPLESDMAGQPPSGLEAATASITTITPQEVPSNSNAAVIFVDTSQDFSSGHVPGARWVARGWMELRIGEVVPGKQTPIIVTCTDGQASLLAGATLKELGYTNVSAMSGGMASWRSANLPAEQGLTGVLALPGDIPADVVLTGPERNYADTMTYLRWETALGEKYRA
jgi:rhodanese-related sulfurtransferase